MVAVLLGSLATLAATGCTQVASTNLIGKISNKKVAAKIEEINADTEKSEEEKASEIANVETKSYLASFGASVITTALVAAAGTAITAAIAAGCSDAPVEDTADSSAE